MAIPNRDAKHSISRANQLDPSIGFDVLDKVLSAVPSLVMIVNEAREIVYANVAMLDFLGVAGTDIIGKAPGEVLGCLHALEASAARGCTPFCGYCGANRALREGWQGSRSVLECRITRSTEVDPPALNLRLWSTPIALADESFVLIAAADISDEKRRQALERIFFHDILNTATIVDGAAKLLLSMESEEDTTSVKMLLSQVTGRLIDEILTQRDFVELETQHLTPKADKIEVQAFLQGLVDSYLSHDLSSGRDIRIDPETVTISFTIDKVLLGRVLSNLLKNAVEASEKGETISLGYQLDGDATIAFWVHNDAVMPEAVRLQVFQRAFTTKGGGRGLGTYSAKLLTERYLEGEIGFVSELGRGTTFRVRYPLNPSYAEDGDSELRP